MSIEWGTLPPPPNDPPPVGVWGRLESSLRLARKDLDKLDPLTRAIAEALARHMFGVRERLLDNPAKESDLTLAEAVSATPWFRHAADLHLAEKALSRASEGSSRYDQLKPIFTQYALPERAEPYVRELTNTYIYGFDAPCIAFCGAALEQILKDALISVGEFTEARVERERPSAETLLVLARRRRLVMATDEDARALFEHRNRVMHKHMWDDKIIRNVALGCIERFARVVRELGSPHSK